jgi:hypothetical protein
MLVTAILNCMLVLLHGSARCRHHETMSNKIFDYITCGDSGNDIDLGVSCTLLPGLVCMLRSMLP